MTHVEAPAAAGRPRDYMDTAPFWAATREGRLLLQYCPETGRFQHFPRPGSVFTGSRRLAWREASGRGSLAGWTVDRISAASPEGPRIHALVDLEEGVRWLTWLVDCQPEALRTALPVTVRWIRIDDSRSWPAFAPAREDASNRTG